MTKLFVGGLAYSVTNQQLTDLFNQFGQVDSANVIFDKFSNQSKGFGFVEMPNDSEANEAINKLNGSTFEGRTLGVSVARPKEDRPNNGGFDNRGGGNNRNSGGGRGGYRERR